MDPRAQGRPSSQGLWPMRQELSFSLLTVRGGGGGSKGSSTRLMALVFYWYRSRDYEQDGWRVGEQPEKRCVLWSSHWSKVLAAVLRGSRNEGCKRGRGLNCVSDL